MAATDFMRARPPRRGGSYPAERKATFGAF